ncbi:MAG: patatin-like phospholipase family protein [Pseudomonadales bacterium]
MSSLVCWVVFFVVFSSPFVAGAACPKGEEIKRPKIGLVLGGGGARGAAHIGVIKRLEELNIPIDYVAGTSMGSLVGALYATGMNADELDRTIRSLEWADLFNDNVRRTDRPFRRKRDDDLSLFGPKFGVGRDSTLLPRGAISGQKISFLFESLVHDRVQVDDFDDLPVPFRAVAADIATGRVVVLDSGNLALAMRASMSVPGVFDPVELNGHLLVDGGIVNNVPVDVVRTMGADRLIVVDVGSPLTPRDELNNLLSVLGQMTGMLIRNNVEAQLATLKQGDLLIRPDLVNVTSTDFAKSSQAIDIGYRAADELSESLASFSVSAAEHQAHRLRIESCTASSNVIQFVRLNNQSRFSDSLILERLRIEEGRPLNADTLEEDIQQIYIQWLPFLDSQAREDQRIVEPRLVIQPYELDNFRWRRAAFDA